MGTPVQRYATFHVDASTLRKLPHGGVSVQGQITHPGVFKYRADNGSPRYEYRPDSEVFSPASLASFEDTAITIGHPRRPDGATRTVDPATWRQDSVGHVRNVRREGENVVADLIIQHADAISAIDAGKLKELSCGYTLTVEETPGVTPDGQRYDAVQKDIVGNHVALLATGTARGGRECVLRVDGNEDPPGDPSPGQAGVVPTLACDMPDPAPAPAATNTELAVALARADAAEARVAELQAAANDGARMDALVAERTALVSVATADGIAVRGLSNKQLKGAIVAKRSPSNASRVDSMSDETLDAVYASVMERPAPAVVAAQVALATAIAPGTRADAASPTTERADALDNARTRNAKAQASAFDPNLTHSPPPGASLERRPAPAAA